MISRFSEIYRVLRENKGAVLVQIIFWGDNPQLVLNRLFLKLNLGPRSKVSFRLSLRNYIDMSEPITSVLHHNSQACVLRKYEALFISLMWDKVLKNGPSKIC